MDAVQVFVVRIYRRHSKNPAAIAGVVDLIGSGGKRAFGSFEELAAILRDGHMRRQPALVLVPGKSET